MPKRILHVVGGVVLCASFAQRASAGDAAPKPPVPSTASATSPLPSPADNPEETPSAKPASATVPSLARVIELAKDKAPAVAVARANVEVGRSAFVNARLNPLTNPYIEVTGDRGTTGTKDLTVQGSLWFPIEISGQREKREAEAGALVDWASAEVKATKAEAVAQAVRAYGQLVVAHARIKTLNELAEVARSEAAYYQGRLKERDANELDAKLAELEAARHAVALAEGEADRSRALTAVGVATGGTYTDAPSDGPAPPAPKASTVVTSAAKIPAVQASEAQAVFHAREKERAAIEAHTPINVIVSVGRGDLGETRFGAGLSWSIPVLRMNQGEQARAEANRAKAVLERDLKARIATTTAEGLTKERVEIRKAIDAITTLAEPAAQAAVDAAVAMEQAGKGDLLRVLTARRDLALLKQRRLDLLQREWAVVGDLVALTGEMP